MLLFGKQAYTHTQFCAVLVKNEIRTRYGHGMIFNVLPVSKEQNQRISNVDEGHGTVRKRVCGKQRLILYSKILLIQSASFRLTPIKDPPYCQRPTITYHTFQTQISTSTDIKTKNAARPRNTSQSTQTAPQQSTQRRHTTAQSLRHTANRTKPAAT